ncbi:MAG: hypothetical protein AVDCRST_MAG68-1054, partial [uncultured Gemmatimonadetes bacterium]
GTHGRSGGPGAGGGAGRGPRRGAVGGEAGADGVRGARHRVRDRGDHRGAGGHGSARRRGPARRLRRDPAAPRRQVHARPAGDGARGLLRVALRGGGAGSGARRRRQARPLRPERHRARGPRPLGRAHGPGLAERRRGRRLRLVDREGAGRPRRTLPGGGGRAGDRRLRRHAAGESVQVQDGQAPGPLPTEPGCPPVGRARVPRRAGRARRRLRRDWLLPPAGRPAGERQSDAGAGRGAGRPARHLVRTLAAGPGRARPGRLRRHAAPQGSLPADHARL